jgi:hypothetical protein
LNQYLRSSKKSNLNGDQHSLSQRSDLIIKHNEKIQGSP